MSWPEPEWGYPEPGLRDVARQEYARRRGITVAELDAESERRDWEFAAQVVALADQMGPEALVEMCRRRLTKP